jgi:hypothetical protein
MSTLLCFQPLTYSMDRQMLLEGSKAILNNKFVQAVALGALGYFGNQAISNYLEKNSFFKDYDLPSVDEKTCLNVGSVNSMIKNAKIITQFNISNDDDMRDQIAQKFIVGTLANFLNGKVDPFARFIFTNIWNNGRSVKATVEELPNFSSFSEKKLFILGLGMIGGMIRSTIPTLLEKYGWEKSNPLFPFVTLMGQLAARSFINQITTKLITSNDYLSAEYKDKDGNFNWSKFKSDVSLRKSVADTFDFGINIYKQLS